MKFLTSLVEKLYFALLDAELDAPGFDADDIEDLFIALSDREDLKNFLKALMAHDVQDYFRASSEGNRQMIRGKYVRAKYLYRNLLLKGVAKPKASEKPIQKNDRKIAGRYG